MQFLQNCEVVQITLTMGVTHRKKRPKEITNCGAVQVGVTMGEAHRNEQPHK